MEFSPFSHLFSPVLRALDQLDDPVFRGVLFRSLAWSLLCFAALHFVTLWALHRFLELQQIRRLFISSDQSAT